MQIPMPLRSVGGAEKSRAKRRRKPRESMDGGAAGREQARKHRLIIVTKKSENNFVFPIDYPKRFGYCGGVMTMTPVSTRFVFKSILFDNPESVYEVYDREIREAWRISVLLDGRAWSFYSDRHTEEFRDAFMAYLEGRREAEISKLVEMGRRHGCDYVKEYAPSLVNLIWIDGRPSN